MAFGGHGRRQAGAGDVGEAVDAIGLATAGLSRIRQSLDAAGAPLAATYVEGALDALSYAVEAALWVFGPVDGRQDDCEAWAGTVRVRLERQHAGVYADLAKPVVVPPPEWAARSLGADLMGATDLLETLRSDEVACGLMAAALGHSDWINMPTGEVFVGDPLASSAVVATAVGRTSFPRWTRRQMGGLIHRRSADALAALGWRRLTGAALPTT